MRDEQDDVHTGLHAQCRLPFRGSQDGKDSEESYDPAMLSRPINGGRSKRFPEHLHLSQGAIRRLRSPTESSMSTLSSISSTHIPDSATTCSLSTLASPISTSYASEVIEQFAKHTLNPSRASSRIFHRPRGSNATCSTFVNDEEEALYLARRKELEPDIASVHGTEQVAKLHEQENQSSPLSEVTVEELPTLRNSQAARLAVSPRTRSSDGWETTSTASDDYTHDDADAILDYTLQLVYGVDSNESPVPHNYLHRLTREYLSRIGNAMREECEDTDQVQQRSSTGFSSSSISGGNIGDDPNKGEKRKKPDQSDKGGDDFSDHEGYPLQAKRMKPTPSDDNLRLSCPFRKRNPKRFNVRDHHSCAMTYFPKFAELRQHIVKQHKRDDPSAFVCDRCNTDFPSRKGLREHQRLPKEEMCDISEHNPESGIDGPTSNKLLSRKRASGASPYVQWREIWNILFPDDDDSAIQPYDFTPVIEHFEISHHFERSFKFLQASLRDMMENPATLETLAAKFHQCFIETVDQCILNAQNMPYANRSNKKPEPSKFRNSTCVAKRGSSRPDSGIIIDDVSEESGSIVHAALRHNNSVRTVRSTQRDSSRTVGPRELLPSSQSIFTGSDETLLEQISKGDGDSMGFGTTAAPMDPASVQAWNNAVLSQQMTPQSVDSLQPGPYSSVVDMNGHGDMMYSEDSFYQMFGAIPAGFSGFVGQPRE